MSDVSEQRAAIGSLGAPAGRDVVERVTAERLRPLHAVEAEGLAAGLEATLAAERAARKKAESEANEMAVLVARVRTQLAEEREARESAEATANKMAALVAQEHDRSRKLEDELRLAWAQVPMVEQRDIRPAKPSLSERARRALRR
jgi:hypothetical protein